MGKDPPDGTATEGQTFWEHLKELRSRLIYIAISVAVGFFVGWGFREELFGLLTAPVREGLAVHGIHRLTAIEAAEAMVVYLKLSLSAAVVLTVPVTLYQLWAFVRPGLLEREIRPMRRVVVLAFFMFVIGVLFCYRLVLPLVMEFLAAFTLGSGGVEFQVTMNSAYSTALALLVGFGLVFELPLVMVLLATTPLVDWRKYLKWIRYAIVGAFVIGAVFTPPDVLSQFLMAVPLTLLYGVGIFLSYLMEKRRLRGGEAARGPDWGLMGMVLGLGGLAALFVLPQPLPPVAFLPYGAESVNWAAGGRAPTCGGLERGIPGWAEDAPERTAGPEAKPAQETEAKPAQETEAKPAQETEAKPAQETGTEWACARYAEGNLLVLRAPEDWEEGSCPASGDTGGEGGQANTCATDGELLVAGQRLLVARFLHNKKMRLVDSDPVLPPDLSAESLWISLRRTEGRQPPFVRISRVGTEPERLRLDLSFGDAQRAREFSAMVEEGKGMPAPAKPAAGELAGLQRGLLELTGVVEELARAVEAECDQAKARSGSETTVRADLAGRLAKVKTLLAGLDGMDGGRHGLAECAGAACAYALLANRLPEPDEVETSGRLVTVWFRSEAISGGAETFLAELAAAR